MEYLHIQRMARVPKPPYNYIIFDVESTLCSIEGMDFLAAQKGRMTEVGELTRSAMEGVMPFGESFRKRIEILRPSLDEVRALGDAYLAHCVEDAKPVLQALEALEKKVYLISGGFWRTIGVVADACGIPRAHTFACRLSFHRDGAYRDYDHGSFIFSPEGKRAPLYHLHGTKAYVGDAATDAAVYDDVHLLIGFTGVVHRQVLAECADVLVTTKSLAPVLHYLLSTEEQSLLAEQRKFKSLMEKSRMLATLP